MNTGSAHPIRGSVVLAVLMLLCIPPHSSRGGEPPETIEPSASCTTNECHADVGKDRHPHWPDMTAVGECEKCHVPEENLHAFTLAEPPELCVDCHEEIGDLIDSATTLHDPAEDCTDCHAPHGGEGSALLLGVGDDEDLKPLCFECHDAEEILGDEFKHGPAEQGECTLCHDPHASSERSLLLGGVLELCGDCHDDVAQAVEDSEYVHDPAQDGCTDCHNPHSGPSPMMLRAEKRGVCAECHDDIVDEAETAAVDHGPVLTGDECLNCHSPHASDNPAILLEPQRNLCLGCHDKPVESGDSTLMDMAGWLSENKAWHAPIREDGCTGCHQPHGSENFRLLRGPFPPKFYADFDVAAYGLCFSCHEKAAVTVERTRTLTKFRDGSRNLHFLHVNKPRRGRTCRACHELHASPNPLHIRREVPYGKWSMPINFQKNETGGSCHPGCHTIESYDRNAEDFPESH